MAHLGFFCPESVQRRQWLSERSYADLVALYQFLPGPASSQVGMALGLLRAEVPGALAGVNAAVVGLLLAALYQPVWVSAVQSGGDVVLLAWAALVLWRAPPWLVVLAGAGAGVWVQAALALAHPVVVL